MTIFDIPYINGYKTAIGGWGLLLVGIAKALVDLSNLVAHVGNCLAGQIDLLTCFQDGQSLLTAMVISFGGLAALGIGHKIQKASAGN